MSEKMDIVAFGEALLRTEDLDPVYCGLWRAHLPRPQLNRWLLAYWCFYHVGAASYISEMQGDGFWRTMMLAAQNNTGLGPGDIADLPSARWPRAAERRHFRGLACEKAVDKLRQMFPDPTKAVRSLTVYDTEQDIMREIQAWPLFGPWIAFKAADMLERCTGQKVRFDPNIGLIYSEPKKGLELWAEHSGAGAALDLEEHYQGLLDHFGRIKAPPALDRPCGPQEVETILCKWKSHMNGHYVVGKDIREQRAVLAGWGKTADKILRVYPKEVVR